MHLFFWWIPFSVDGVVCGGEAELAFWGFREIPSGRYQPGIRSLDSGEFFFSDLGLIPLSVEYVHASFKHT